MEQIAAFFVGDSFPDLHLLLQRMWSGIEKHPTTILLRLFLRRDPRDHRFREAVDTLPVAVSDAVLIRGHVDHVSHALRRGNMSVRLLVREHDQAIALAV